MTDLLYDFKGAYYLVGQLMARPISILILSYDLYLVSDLKVNFLLLFVYLLSIPALRLSYVTLYSFLRAI